MTNVHPEQRAPHCAPRALPILPGTMRSLWKTRKGISQGCGREKQGALGEMCLSCVRSGSPNIPNLSTALVQATGEAKDQGQGLEYLQITSQGLFEAFPTALKDAAWE